MFLNMMNKKKKGFTLIELIAVIAILGILIAIIAPRMMGYTDSAKLSTVKANAKTLITAIEVYNSTAIDHPVIGDTTVKQLKAGKVNETDALHGDDNAEQSLIDTAKDIEAGDNDINDDNNYTQLKAVLNATAYGSIGL